MMIDRESPTRGDACTNELVCDDKNATALYVLLASWYWDKARARAASHPDEVRTWVQKVDPVIKKIRWKVLPLHAAMIFKAPLDVVECLLNEYPAAAKEKDDKGMLPLHVAFRHKAEGDESSLATLVDDYPQGCAIKDNCNRFPIDFAADGTTFSVDFLKKYSAAFAKYHESKDMEATRAVSKAKMDKLKSSHRESISTMEKEHKQSLRHLKQELLQEQHSLRTQHEQEMDDLRDLLSREVVSTSQNTTNVELKMNSLERSFADEKEKCRDLETTLRKQKLYEAELREQLRKLLIDQQTIHTSYLQQQRQLQEAQHFREQILSSLLIKEDGKVLEKSRDICELSEQLEFRTEKLLDSQQQINQAESDSQRQSNPVEPEGYLRPLG